MADQRVQVARTTPSMLAFARALVRTWRSSVGSLPNREQAGILWAHFAGETGDGVYCWNWNFGNAKFAPGSGGTFMSLAGVWECFTLRDEDGDGDVDGDDRVMLIARLLRTGAWREDASSDHAKACGTSRVSLLATGDNAMSWFRAYASLDQGMAAFVAAKSNPKSRYASAWTHVLDGNADGYARELGARGYYTASPDAYSRAMIKKHAAWMLSDACDEAIAELLAMTEAPTRPELVDPPQDETPLVDFPIVHAALEFAPRVYDLDDPGDKP